MFVKHGCPCSNKVKIWQNLQVPHFDPAQGHLMSRKCEKLSDELTVQVWLLYHHPNFNKGGMRFHTDGGRPFRPDIKIMLLVINDANEKLSNMKVPFYGY